MASPPDSTYPPKPVCSSRMGIIQEERLNKESSTTHKLLWTSACYWYPRLEALSIWTQYRPGKICALVEPRRWSVPL